MMKWTHDKENNLWRSGDYELIPSETAAARTIGPWHAKYKGDYLITKGRRPTSVSFATRGHGIEYIERHALRRAVRELCDILHPLTLKREGWSDATRTHAIKTVVAASELLP